MFLFYLITLFYGSNSLPLSLLSMPSVNKTKSNDDDLLAKIKSNPQKFVSEFQNLDPADLKHIISLLEELREKSVARENELVTDLNNKNSALADANSNVITAGDALDVANQAVTDAETDLAQKNDAVTEQQGILNGKQADAAAAEADLTTKKAIHKTKQTERNVAQTAHDDEVPDLNDEQQILTDVVNMLQGLHDKHTGGEVKINFGQPGQSQEGFTQLGLNDNAISSFSGTFDFEGRTCTIAISGFQYTRSNYPAVTGGDYTNLSRLLRSSFLCNSACAISVTIGNLKPSNQYQMTTYHHSTHAAGVKFKLKYNGNSESPLRQSSNGLAPNPPLIHVEQVTSTDSGEISFTMKYDGVVVGHMDLNALEIKDL